MGSLAFKRAEKLQKTRRERSRWTHILDGSRVPTRREGPQGEWPEQLSTVNVFSALHFFWEFFARPNTTCTNKRSAK